MNRGNVKWIAIAFLVLGLIRFAHQMHWLDMFESSKGRVQSAYHVRDRVSDE